MATKRHTHKYHKIEIASGKLWACALPDCTHYMPKHLENTIPGKNSICWSCGNEFMLNSINMLNDMPICINCNPQTKRLEDFLRSRETNEIVKAIEKE